MKNVSGVKVLFHQHPKKEFAERTAVTLIFDSTFTKEVVERDIIQRMVDLHGGLLSGAEWGYRSYKNSGIKFFERSKPRGWAILSGKIMEVPVSHEEEYYSPEAGDTDRYVVACPNLEEVDANELIESSVKLLIPVESMMWENPTQDLNPMFAAPEEFEAFEGFLRMLREHPESDVLVDRLRRMRFYEGLEQVQLHLIFPENDNE